jgi:hypothetical protein
VLGVLIGVVLIQRTDGLICLSPANVKWTIVRGGGRCEEYGEED